MEFPFGHHDHRRDDDDGSDAHRTHHFNAGDEDPESFYPRPPGDHHASHEPGYDPPRQNFDAAIRHVAQEYAPSAPFFDAAADPPSYGGDPVVNVGYDTPYGGGGGGGSGGYGREEGRLRPGYVDYVRIFTKAGEDYSLTICEGKVVLTRKDSNDEYQHWFKDLRYSTKVKDEEGFPSFALVNKVTGESLKHSIGATQPVLLVPYNPDYLDESVLWTESRDLGDGFRCIRMVNNIGLNFDAFLGDEDNGGVHEGTILVLWEWLEGKNQRWKIVPHY